MVYCSWKVAIRYLLCSTRWMPSHLTVYGGALIQRDVRHIADAITSETNGYCSACHRLDGLLMADEHEAHTA